MITFFKPSKYFFIVIFFAIIFSVFLIPSSVFAEGQSCNPNDPDAICNNAGTPTPLPPGSSVNYGTGENIPVSVSTDENFSVSMGESFGISWGVSWNTNEYSGGRILYVVTLYRDGAYLAELGRADSNNLEQPPISGIYAVSNGITRDTEYSVVAELQYEIQGSPQTYTSTDTVTVSITNTPTCEITSFTASASGQTGTTLTFTFKDVVSNRTDVAFPWSISLLEGTNSPTPSAGVNSSGISLVGNITARNMYLLACGGATRTLVVTPPPITFPPSSNGGGACALDSDANRFGEPIVVPSSYQLLGTCRVANYSEAPGMFGVNGATLNIDGTCFPPANTNYVVLNIYTDDGGSVRVNGNTIHSVAPTCGIKVFELEVKNMQAGATNNVNITAVNSELGGLGGDAKFSFYSTGTTVAGSLTPVIIAPSCSDTNYSVEVAWWPPVNNSVNVFIDDNGTASSWWKSGVDGNAGSTSAPSGFTQRIPGGPQTLTFAPGTQHSTFIHNGGIDGPIAYWTVGSCASTIYTLTIVTSGNGSGVGVGAGPYNYGGVASIGANPNPGSVFTGWGGNPDCGDGSVIMDSNKTCVANFTTNGNCSDGIQNGDETSVDRGGRCGNGEPDLTASSVSPTTVIANTAVGISASAINQGSNSTGSSFWSIFQVTPDPDNWGAIVNLPAVSSSAINGGGSGTIGTTHTFSSGTHFARLCVDKAGVGETGSITESNENNNCGAWTTIISSVAQPPVVNGVCGTRNTTYPARTTEYPGGSTYCAVGTPTSSPSFPPPGGSVNWYCVGSGASSGQCTASVEIPKFNVTVNAVIRAGGSILSQDGAINCGLTCSSQYREGSNIVLTAIPKSSYWKFSGWTGDCSSTNLNVCTILNVVSDKNINAVFVLRQFKYIEF